MSETTETASPETEVRQDKTEQIKRFRKLRERIEACMMAARKALKAEEIEQAQERIKEPNERLQDLIDLQDKDNPIQVRCVRRVVDELQRLTKKVEGSRSKKGKAKKSSKAASEKEPEGIPVDEHQWLLNALYLIQRDHKDIFSELHMKKCVNWAKRFEKQGYSDEKAMVTINNYIKKYKLIHLWNKDDVTRRINLSM